MAENWGVNHETENSCIQFNGFYIITTRSFFCCTIKA